MLAANFFTFILSFSVTHCRKGFAGIIFIINSIAVYFINTYSVIIDESMIGNILNTNYEESSSFFSYKLILYLVILGILPSIFIIKAKIIKEVPKKFLITSSLTLLFMVTLAFANASNWLWIDKNSKHWVGLQCPVLFGQYFSLLYSSG